MKTIITIVISVLLSLVLSAQDVVNNNTTICWDTSLSMAVRDINKDFSVLEKVFQRNENQEVQLLLFSMSVEEKTYTVLNGDWSDLKKDLSAIQYEGGTVYTSLSSSIKNPNVYVFTDGNKIVSKDILALDGKSYLINTSPSRDVAFLERTALVNKSRLMDFATMLPENVQKLQEQKSAGKQQERTAQIIEGTVYIDNKPTPNVKVTVKGISDSFLTGPSGSFAVAAQVGDTLVVTSRNNKTLKLVPIEAMRQLNVFMNANIVSLDEVVVVEKKLEEELMITGYGLQDKKALGYTISTIGEDEISEVETTVDQSLINKVSGLKIPNGSGMGKKAGGTLGRAEIRGRNTLNMNPYALVVVNGVPMARSSRLTNMRDGSMTETQTSGVSSTITNYDFIDPSNIANITVLKGLAATNAYGSEGGNGVILITTKTAVDGTGIEEKKDLALVQNNVYNEEEAVASKTPSEFNFGKSLSDAAAYKTYTVARDRDPENMKLYLAAFQFFKDRDLKLAKNIMSSALEILNDNVEIMKVVASAFAIAEDHENVVRINEEIILKSPNDVNAYYQKASAKRGLGKYQEALNELLALAEGNKYFSVNASEIKKTLDRDIKNLIFKHKNQINTANVDTKYLNNIRYKVRLVFEWNQPGAEFELQFVNPQKRFFNWEHTNTEIRSRIEDEIKNNYRIEEYEFYGDVEGKWVINAKYLGGDLGSKQIPLVLKCTIYKDFGYATESKEEVLVAFSSMNEKKNINTLLVE